MLLILTISFAFQTWHTSRASTSLPSMSVIGSAQPDVVRIKVYVSRKTTTYLLIKIILFFFEETEQ